MKVSLNWVKQFVEVDLPIEQLVQKIGSQLGEVEKVINLGDKYKNIIVSKVVSCEKHPNADKLSVCLIDDGGVAGDIDRDERGLVQVVCGAPNVREGLTVAWLPPGSVVPSTYDKDPFKLGARELRGIVSNGMLASASELAIGEDHNGIVELADDLPAGSDFAGAFELDDYIIDIENKMFTHRPDCFGILGVAREIAGITGTKFSSPDWYLSPLNHIKAKADKLEIKYENKAGDLVPRFTLLTMKDIEVKPSPFMLQVELAKVGLRPINNIVDITNYIMYLTGQPTHAYDADKLAKYGDLSIETRMSRKGDKITLLNSKEIEFQDDSTVLITSNDVPVGVAGCMGGADTEVDENTKNIVLECANFDMYSIRRTSMKYGIFTDAVTRFNKGQSNLQNVIVIEEMADMVGAMAGGQIASSVLDNKTDLVNPMSSVQVTSEFINSRLGSTLTDGDIIKLLSNVEFSVSIEDGILDITPPFWRTDILISEDVVEEVGRLYGYDNLPLALPVRQLAPVDLDRDLSLKKDVRSILSRLGANELLNYSFVHKNLLNKANQDENLAFKITNAISPDLQFYRLSLTPSLLEKIHPNIKLGFNEFALFEQGVVHTKDQLDNNSLPIESSRVSFVCAKASIQNNLNEGSPYFLAKKYLSNLLDPTIEYRDLQSVDFESNADKQSAAPYEPKRSAILYSNGKIVGVVGEFKQDVKGAFKLPEYCAGFEISTSAINVKSSNYQPLSRFPSTEQDITLSVSADVTYRDLHNCLVDAFMAEEGLTVGVFPQSIYSKNDKLKNVSFRIKVTPLEKTLRTEYVNGLLDKASKKAHDKLGAIRI